MNCTAFIKKGVNSNVKQMSKKIGSMIVIQGRIQDFWTADLEPQRGLDCYILSSPII